MGHALARLVRVNYVRELPRVCLQVVMSEDRSRVIVELAGEGLFVVHPFEGEALFVEELYARIRRRARKDVPHKERLRVGHVNSLVGDMVECQLNLGVALDVELDLWPVGL